jgi:hypothetical protein
MPNNKKADDMEARIRYLKPASIELSFDFRNEIRMYNDILSVSSPRKNEMK